MINNKEFAKRLKIVLDFYPLSATAFAKKINVQRSSISHLLSGRNKPSLDFVLKVLKEFKEVEMYWLLYGKGVFPNTETITKKQEATPTLFSQNIVQKEIISKFSEKLQSNSAKKKIDCIVIFYLDGTFKEYTQIK
ncbi:MAG: helix-turn-helix domain-containing protein [Flavobacteriaceae bacterium]|nr:helix-turn-helix domain-containing protein [Flavobacteriaceae bacterium]